MLVLLKCFQNPWMLSIDVLNNQLTSMLRNMTPEVVPQVLGQHLKLGHFEPWNLAHVEVN